jgi:predicted nucleic acid-binding protein
LVIIIYMYVLDTNAIIYYLKDEPYAVNTLEDIFSQDSPIFISTITESELFGFPSLTDQEYSEIDSILSTLSIIPFDSLLARRAGLIRRVYNIKIPDSIIAATTLFTNSSLVTRNTGDYKKIRGLKLIRI